MTRLKNDDPPAHRLHVVPAAFLILRKDGKILLSRRANTGFMDGSYIVPAGHLDGAETPEQAMVREAGEELGIRIDPAGMRFAHVLYKVASEGGYERVDFFFECDEWQGEITNLEPGKCDDLKWFPADELPENMVPEVRFVLERIEAGEMYSTHNFS